MSAMRAPNLPPSNLLKLPKIAYCADFAISLLCEVIYD